MSEADERFKRLNSNSPVVTIELRDHIVAMNKEDVYLVDDKDWHLENKDNGGPLFKYISEDDGKYRYLHREIAEKATSDDKSIDWENHQFLDVDENMKRICVSFENGNHLDLTRDNLRLGSGAAGPKTYSKRKKKKKKTVNRRSVSRKNDDAWKVEKKTPQFNVPNSVTGWKCPDCKTPINPNTKYCPICVGE